MQDFYLFMYFYTVNEVKDLSISSKIKKNTTE